MAMPNFPVMRANEVLFVSFLARALLCWILATAAVEPWRLRKIAFKSANEAGSMLVAGAVGDFFDTHVAVPQQVSCMIQPLLGQHTAETSSGLLFE
jgi:hypothetical protein